MEKNKGKGGRPPVIDENVLHILEEAFSNGATDAEACFVANIGQSTLYKYQIENPEFIERKDGLKNMIKYQAKANIAKAIKSNAKIDDSKWYLERKEKSEFGNNLNITVDDKEDANNAIDEFLNGNK